MTPYFLIRFTVVLFILFQWNAIAQVKMCSWNIQNFGKAKSDSEIVFIAETLKDYDLVAIVEVVAGNGGAQAVARLADELNRKGAKWDYTVSDPTSSAAGGTERYAFIWKTAKLFKVGDAWLEKRYHLEMDREPYFATFRSGEKEFTVAAFHAIPKSKQPEREIKYLKFMRELYPGMTIIYCGDFNCPQSHTVFNPLRSQSYRPALVDCKTSLKMEPKNGECLASECDNIFYPEDRVLALEAGAVHFYRGFRTLKAARLISDHLPVFLVFELFSR